MALNSRVSILLSIGRFQKSSTLTNIISVALVLIGFGAGASVFLFGEQFAQLFLSRTSPTIDNVDNSDTIDVICKYIWFTWIIITLEFIYTTLHSIVRNLRGQRTSTIVNLISWWMLGIPCSVLLGFSLDYGLYGLLISFSASLFIASLILLIIVLRTDYLQETIHFRELVRIIRHSCNIETIQQRTQLFITLSNATMIGSVGRHGCRRLSSSLSLYLNSRSTKAVVNQVIEEDNDFTTTNPNSKSKSIQNSKNSKNKQNSRLSTAEVLGFQYDKQNPGSIRSSKEFEISRTTQSPISNQQHQHQYTNTQSLNNLLSPNKITNIEEVSVLDSYNNNNVVSPRREDLRYNPPQHESQVIRPNIVANVGKNGNIGNMGNIGHNGSKSNSNSNSNGSGRIRWNTTNTNHLKNLVSPKRHMSAESSFHGSVASYAKLKGGDNVNNNYESSDDSDDTSLDYENINNINEMDENNILQIKNFNKKQEKKRLKIKRATMPVDLRGNVKAMPMKKLPPNPNNARQTKSHRDIGANIRNNNNNNNNNEEIRIKSHNVDEYWNGQKLPPKKSLIDGLNVVDDKGNIGIDYENLKRKLSDMTVTTVNTENTQITQANGINGLNRLNGVNSNVGSNVNSNFDSMKGNVDKDSVMERNKDNLNVLRVVDAVNVSVNTGANGRQMRQQGNDVGIGGTGGTGGMGGSSMSVGLSDSLAIRDLKDDVSDAGKSEQMREIAEEDDEKRSEISFDTNVATIGGESPVHINNNNNNNGRIAQHNGFQQNIKHMQYQNYPKRPLPNVMNNGMNNRNQVNQQRQQFNNNNNNNNNNGGFAFGAINFGGRQ